MSACRSQEAERYLGRYGYQTHAAMEAFYASATPEAMDALLAAYNATFGLWTLGVPLAANESK